MCVASPRHIHSLPLHQILTLTFTSVLGVKEIDIAATLEHIRDQRPGMVQTKVHFDALYPVQAKVEAAFMG